MQNRPPDLVGGMPLVCYTHLDARHRLTGNTHHYVGSELIGRLAGLAIARSGDDAYSLFGCDAEWAVVTDTFHASLEDAKEQAEFEYEGTHETWITPHSKHSVPEFPCPACGFLVFSEPSGSYDICRVCNWEDDEVQLRFPGYGGGANVESLCEHQRVVLGRIPADLLVHKGFRRSADWRPLLPAECVSDPDDRDPYAYYWRRTAP